MKKFPTLSVLAAACLWGSMGIFVRRIETGGFSPMDIVAIRSLSAFLILFLYTLVHKRTLLVIRWSDILIFIGSGVCSITFFNFCYFTTITRTSLSVAAVLLYTAPSFVIVLSSLLFKERITLRKLTALMMSFAGCVLVSGILKASLQLEVSDLLIGVGAGLGYALFSIFSRIALNRGYFPLTITLYTFLFAGISALPFIRITETVQKIGQNARLWADLIGMVLLVTIAAYALYTHGLKYLEAGNASIMACIEPVVATFIGFWVYHESLTMMELTGISLVLSSSILVNLSPQIRKGVKHEINQV